MPTVWSSHRVIAATLAALGSAGVLPACDRQGSRPATEVPGAAPPSAAVRVPDGIEPLTAAQEADRDLEGPTDEELQRMLEASDGEFPTLLESACGAEATCSVDATCGVCGAASCGAVPEN